MGFKNPWLEKRKKRKCEYRPLSKREIKVIEPHKVKPKKHGSKHDLSVCKGSGEIVQHPKTKHYDKDGNLVYPGDTHYEPTGININEPPWKELLETMIEDNETKMIVEFRVMDFARKPHEVLKELGLSTYRSFAATKVEMEKSVSIRDDGLLSAYGNPTIPEPTLCLSLQPIIPSFASTKTRSSACCLASIA